MNIVIQCAGGKRGNFFASKGGRRIFFVADPSMAPTRDGYIYAHPDDFVEDGSTWRDALLRYNELAENPLGLSCAFELYENPVYRRLVTKFGEGKVFILSAGWGLIKAGFRTPYYDITLSRIVKKKGEPYKFREKEAAWRDFCQLPPESDEPILFLGGKDYVPLFSAITREHKGQRIIFYNSDIPQTAPGCLLQRYLTSTRTNWHYECANALIDGRLGEVVGKPLGRETSPNTFPWKTAARIDANEPTGERITPFQCGSTASANAPPRADDFRRALQEVLQEAESNGVPQVDVAAGDLHRRAGGYPGRNHRMPSCCDVMRGTMRPGDEVLTSPLAGRGAALLVRYRLPRAR
jgi:hypothetical protein